METKSIKKSSHKAYTVLAFIAVIISIILGFSIVDWQWWLIIILTGGIGGIIIEKFEL